MTESTPINKKNLSHLRHAGCILSSYTFGMIAGNLAFPFFLGADDTSDGMPAYLMAIITFILGWPLLLLALLSFSLVKKHLEKHTFTSCLLVCVTTPALIGYGTEDPNLLFYSFILTLPCAAFYYTCLQRKLTPASFSRKKVALSLCLATVVFLLCGFIGGEWVRYRHYADLLPPGLGTTKPLYKAERAWGFGPGGNEVGLIVYALPEKSALEIEQKGLAFLTSLNREHRRERFNWGETPMTASRYWADYMRLPDKHDYSKETPKLEHYLNRYGYRFGINPPSEFFDMANEALLESGNFYAYPDRGGGGFILVIPRERKIIYAYAG